MRRHCLLVLLRWRLHVLRLESVEFVSRLLVELLRDLDVDQRRYFSVYCILLSFSIGRRNWVFALLRFEIRIRIRFRPLDHLDLIEGPVLRVSQ